MTLRVRTMSPEDAEKLADLHGEMADQAGGSASASNMRSVLTTIGTAVIGSFIGPTTGGISTLTNLFIGISDTSNKAATASYLEGAEDGFNEIARTLRGGGYLAAEVEQLWITYTSVSTRHEFVQGNQQDPGRAYRVLRVLSPSGGWIEL
ncbi:hypothetical protein CAI16_20370 [Virgibacillus dokdonensis]|uniref:Uncharacterized protein n=1 Tax=Virgibacillus dokdonensis TaxID=302167 RepID=A0A3E0WHA1_9BACI|nr:hypothetical protein [Virgibacillus dokdonensis]RFA31613.1 hypothetical protein CAI16_20370 [Virgibacillus dokdonensis]